MIKKIFTLIIFILQGITTIPANTQKLPDKLSFTRQLATEFSNLALKCISREYPNKIGHVLNSAQDIQGPKTLHPAFYGCFDWHSAVHGHWSLIKILKLFPDFPNTGELRSTISNNLTPENINTECLYFQSTGRKSFERTYGWAWLLKLYQELYTWDDPDAKKWKEALEPLKTLIVQKYLLFLPRQNYPIRTGVHPNTAFGLAFALDFARAVKHRELELLIIKKSREYFLTDTHCPASWEPGGEDFFSPCLLEAFLMNRVLSKREFNLWIKNFLPGFAQKKTPSLLKPVTVLDRSDGKLVHLDGLNLSRAWCMFDLAKRVNDPQLKTLLLNTGILHGRNALLNMKSEDYAGGHWLGTFAIYMFSTYKQQKHLSHNPSPIPK
jgi:hypothetical protein